MTETVGTGRHLTDAELAFWTRFHDASRLLEAELSRHLKEDHGMSLAEYEVLVRVDGADGRMRMGVLSDQVVVSTSRLSHTVDRLVTRGWIERAAVATDGRGSDAVLTGVGRSALAACSRRHAEIVRRFLLEPVGQERLREWSEVFGAAVTRLRDRPTR